MLYAYGVSAGDTVLPSGSNANSGLVSLTTKAKIYDAVVNDVIVSLCAWSMTIIFICTVYE